MIFEQAFRNLKKSILISVLIVLMLSLGLFLVIGSASYYRQNSTKLEDFYEAYREDEFRFFSQVIVMDLGNGDNHRIAATVDYYKQMKASEEFEVYTFNYGSLLVPDYKGADNCLTGYDRYQPIRDTYIDPISKKAYSAVNCYTVSPGVFDKFAIQTAEGSDFSDYDCVWREGDVIPVVMGWSFREYYDLGEEFIACASGMQEQLQTHKVVGFLPPDAAVLSIKSIAGDVESLANCILYPAIDLTLLPIPVFATQKRENQLYDVQVQHLCDFVIVSKQERIDLSGYGDQALMGQVSSKRSMVLTPEFVKDANRYFEMLVFAAVLIIAATTVCLALNMTSKLLTSFKTYAIHQISGGTIGSVNWMMIAEIGILLLISNAIAFAASVTAGGRVFTYSRSSVFGVSVTKLSPEAILAALAISAAVGFISILYPMLKLRKTEFDTLLRGRE